MQLFANMHLSASKMLHQSLKKGEIEADNLKRMIAYGTILKPGENTIALYKLVANFNEKTYIQVEYCMETIYWHSVFNSVLKYTFDKLLTK